MARYIDADALMQKLSRMIDFCEKHKVSGLNALFQVGDAIMDCPTADVVEVVRCRDCKYSRERNEDERRYLVEGVLICTSGEAADECWNPVYPSHFCSYGERKE